MTEQEQKAAKIIVGTAVFLGVFYILHTLSIPALSVAYVKPELSAGTFDLWTIVVSIAAPAVAAYVAVSSKVGGLVISLFANLISKLQPTPTAGPTSLPLDEMDKRYAGRSATNKVLSAQQQELKELRAIVDSWSDQEPA